MKNNSQNEDLIDHLKVGVVQTTIDGAKAWTKGAASPQMSLSQDVHVWHEICKAMRAFQDGDQKPKVILFPELSIPSTRLDDFERLVSALNVIAFVGVDYKINYKDGNVKNEGIVFIPNGFWNSKPSKYCSRVIFGKSHPAPLEKSNLENSSPSWSFSGDHNVYIFDLNKYGKVGVSICYDFMDLERALMYRGKIHHLFVLAYNKDLGMFRSLADSLSRTIYCNVVICNTGFYGGSLAVSPYFDAFRREIYSHGGGKLFSTQVFSLPLSKLDSSLKGVPEKYISEKSEKLLFKAPPPGL